MNRQQALNQLRIMRDWHEDNGDGPNADYDAICFAIEALKAQLGTNLAEVGTDTISRQAAIDYCEALMEAERVQQTDDWGYGRERYNQTEVIKQYLEDMPPAQPAPDQNGDLWITVPDIDEVTCIYVQESKSKFCRIFYEERI